MRRTFTVMVLLALLAVGVSPALAHDTAPAAGTAPSVSVF